MPWDKNDYPTSFKNFEPLLKKKAIEVGNALLAEGYPEDRAIPIAISQSKKWLDTATDSEKKAFSKESYPKKNDKHDGEKINQDLLDNDVLVFSKEDKWFVQTKGAEKAAASFKTKDEAITRARETAENKESKVIAFKQGEQPK
ncbi:DUF2188 domain-containing protein [Enterococcus sp. BWR-S5]|uniref:DUF2188 domain-containing protein n=1 Tax=Enterococcus sp. BWR-S5 TaxID=2787714 RepID=UPI0019230A64|nr:DUF2188 domain-containing protein [Enterococcus sp. BWR-S5]MBL1224880.1 DUF2188 domain-containing protein [Enterococcus sp. BWR-S5]